MIDLNVKLAPSLNIVITKQREAVLSAIEK